MSKHKIVWLFALVILALVVLSGVVSAAPGLNWNTTDVYFHEDGRLIVKGYFTNTGTTTISHLDKINFIVDVRTKGENYWTLANFSVYDKNIYLSPGQTVSWYFWTRDVGYTDFTRWYVQWQVRYR